MAVSRLAENEDLLSALAWRLGIPRQDVRPDGREPALARGMHASIRFCFSKDICPIKRRSVDRRFIMRRKVSFARILPQNALAYDDCILRPEHASFASRRYTCTTEYEKFGPHVYDAIRFNYGMHIAVWKKKSSPVGMPRRDGIVRYLSVGGLGEEGWREGGLVIMVAHAVTHRALTSHLSYAGPRRLIGVSPAHAAYHEVKSAANYYPCVAARTDLRGLIDPSHLRDYHERIATDSPGNPYNQYEVLSSHS